MTDDETKVSSSRSLLLLSGGLDSTALAAIERPALCLTVDYGQRPAQAELRAAHKICEQLGLQHEALRIDLGGLGGGLLKSDEPWPGAPSAEWWPFRNQLLVTAAATLALARGMTRVVVGSVAEDGSRHADGTPDFYRRLDELLRMQEGAVTVATPGIAETTAALLRRSGLGEDVLGWTVSCHRAVNPCGACPGCWKRGQVLAEVGLLQPKP